MMDILNGKIRLYNYELSPVGFPSQYNQKGIFLRGRDEDEEFVVERVPLDDIEIENTKSDLFKVGRIRFHPDEEDEVYKKLGIEDRDNIKSDKELMDILMQDNIENIKRISKIKSNTLISRMKSLLFSLERSNRTPPHNISSVVLERNTELKNNGKRNEGGMISKILEADKKANEENKVEETLVELSKKVESLEQENKKKDDELNKSQSALQDLLKMVEDMKKENADDKKDKDIDNTKNKKVEKKETKPKPKSKSETTTKKTANSKKEK